MTKVLTKQELQNLLNVKTSLRQAKLIKKRNAELLEAFEHFRESKRCLIYENDWRNLPYACPHCDLNMRCDSCAWKVEPFHKYLITFCLRATFGGVRYSTVEKVISYSPGHCSVNAYRAVHCSSKKASEVRKFLKGHIEWAEAVIQHGKKG
jgi:hypothetical protein